MKQEITRLIADGAVTLAVGGGIATKYKWFEWFEFITDNAQALGFIASCVFGIVATIFYALTYSKSTLADKNEKDVKLLKDKMDIMLGILKDPDSQNNDTHDKG